MRRKCPRVGSSLNVALKDEPPENVYIGQMSRTETEVIPLLIFQHVKAVIDLYTELTSHRVYVASNYLISLAPMGTSSRSQAGQRCVLNCSGVTMCCVKDTMAVFTLTILPDE